MKKNNKRKTRKELPTPLLVVLSLLYVVIIVLFGICVGFLINSFIINDDIIVNLVVTLVVGVINVSLLTVLMCNSDSENVQPFKWYINNILISFIISLILSAITVGTLGDGDTEYYNYFIGFLIFPLIGILSTPNIVRYVIKDSSKWKNVLYKHGNLHKKKNKDYYKLDTPVPYEKKLLSAVFKENLLNVLVVVVIMAIVILAAIHYMVTDHSYTDSFIHNYMIYRARKSFGFVFFLMIIFLAFGIPIISYYICLIVKRISIIRNHQYLAYHAVVSGGSNGIGIYNNGVCYSYKYCIYIGIKAKDIKNTPCTLIFIPDYVLVVPDSEEYKINKTNNKK